jgi:hypothetical protein
MDFGGSRENNGNREIKNPCFPLQDFSIIFSREDS